QQLLEAIMQADMACIDLNLYLDTHPDCKESLKLYSQYAKDSKQLTQEYESKYGLINAVDINNETHFDWASQPWPWQIGGNS
ncbi:MAG: spore coat protein CotJB, partial [Firmicutes bacterium]|nr:spore coat protein CotJB [Bacillota bacterium]